MRVKKPHLAFLQNIKENLWNSFFCSLSLFLFVGFSFAQETKSSLEINRRNLLKEIQLTNELLESTSSQKQYTLEQYLAIEAQLKSREALITTLTKELIIAEDSIEVLGVKIAHYQEDLESLKDEYAKLIRSEYHNKISGSSLQILLSSANLNDAFQRIKYLQQYEEYRKKQLFLIQKQTKELERIKQKRERNVEETKLLFAATEKQTELMFLGKERLTGIYNNLRTREGELRRSLEDKEYANYQLKTELNKTIADDVSNNEAIEVLSIKDFGANKGKLPWPVSEGIITQYFGTQKHPTIKNIVIHNNGIDIRTRNNANVKAVFNGRIAAISKVPGYGRTIIIKHNNYYSVYSKLSQVAVKKGELIKSGTPIGIVNTVDGVSEMHFEIWFKKQRKNPVSWILKR